MRLKYVSSTAGVRPGRSLLRGLEHGLNWVKSFLMDIIVQYNCPGTTDLTPFDPFDPSSNYSNKYCPGLAFVDTNPL